MGSGTLHIAVGVLKNSDGEVLIARRQAGKPGAGQWEFPGGKRHPGETVQAALQRELEEELGITDCVSTPLIRIRHAYPDRTVLLDTWTVDAWRGTARGAEGQAIQWVQPATLPDAGLLAADAPIASAIRLPATYAVSPPNASGAALGAWLQAPTAPMLRVRLPATSDADYWAQWPDLQAAARGSATELIADRLPDSARQEGLSVHLSAAHAAKLQERPMGLRWFGCSCHSGAALRHAERVGADFAVLGHVQRTPSHADRPALGWAKWGRLVDVAQLPVYAIGGLGSGDVRMARQCGGQGVAAIRGFFDGA